MKKIISLSLLALFVVSLLLLTACGGGSSSKKSDVDPKDSNLVGNWIAKGISLSIGNETATEAIGDEDDVILLTFNPDGTGSLSDGEDSTDFNWVPTEDGAKTSGDLKVEFKEEGDKLTTSIMGIKMTFERQE